MRQLVYSSRARDGCLANAELSEMLRTFRHHNSQTNVSGILLYGYGRFLQLLEGKSDVVSDLYARIAVDVRHFDLHQLDIGFERQLFTGWPMAYAKVEPERDMPGCVGKAPYLDLRLIDEAVTSELLLYYSYRFAQGGASGPHPQELAPGLWAL
jgi:hypothetical protein